MSATPFRGVRTARQPQTVVEFCAAYLQHAGPDEFFSHATAAQLWGLPLPRRLGRQHALHVSVVAPSFPPDMRGVVGHRLSIAHRPAVVQGMPIADVVDAWVQLAAELTVDELVVAGDAIVRRKRPLATMERLQVGVDDSAGRRGIRRAREALALIRPGTDSPAESRLRLVIVRAGLPEPAVHHTVHHEGYFVGTPDLAYPVERIAIEYEGEVHATDVRTFRDDIERRERFEDAGWRVIRVTADHLPRSAPLVERIGRALALRQP